MSDEDGPSRDVLWAVHCEEHGSQQETFVCQHIGEASRAARLWILVEFGGRTRSTSGGRVHERSPDPRLQRSRLRGPLSRKPLDGRACLPVGTVAGGRLHGWFTNGIRARRLGISRSTASPLRRPQRCFWTRWP